MTDTGGNNGSISLFSCTFKFIHSCCLLHSTFALLSFDIICYATALF